MSIQALALRHVHLHTDAWAHWTCPQSNGAHKEEQRHRPGELASLHRHQPNLPCKLQVTEI